jgi:hypothetical protein
VEDLKSGKAQLFIKAHNMTKHTYTDAKQKKAVREFLFSYFQFNTIVGLAGPDINDYVSWCKSKGYSEFEIWENEPDVLMRQLTKVKHPVNYKFGNILEASPKENALFDLDYCVSVRYMKEHLKKFKNNFIMTFSTRIGVKETVSKFFKFRGEQIKNQHEFDGPGLQNIVFNTNLGKYLFITYFDTSAMCCFAKIK